MKNRLYVIEGQDRCGKSTAVNLLRSKITNPKILVLHSSKPPKGVNPETWTRDHYEAVLNTALYLVEAEGCDVIMDRSWLGETVYGPLYRGVSIPQNELEQSFLLEPDYINRIKLLVLVDDASSIASRSDGESMSEDLTFLENERALFKTAFANTSIVNKTLIDWEYEEFSKTALNDIVETLIND